MMSNRERTFRLSQSGLSFSTSAVAIWLHKFFAGTPQSTDFCFFVTMSSLSDSEMNVDSEDSEIYYNAEDMK